MNLAQFLPAGMSMSDAVVVAAALAAVLTVLAVWYGLLERDPTAARIKELARRRQNLMQELVNPGRHATRARGLGFMQQVVQRLKLLKSDQTRAVTEKLAKAGWRSRDALIAYLFAKLVLPAAFGIVASFLFYSLGLYSLPPMARLLVVLCSVAAGLYAPDVLVKNAANKRRHKIRLGLPDALDLMVICAEAGLSLDSALKRVAKEMGLSNPEIADEFGLTSVELGFLQDRSQALKNLTRRCDLPGIRGVVNTLTQSERYGTPLAQSLRVLSAEFRNERLMKAEEKAARLPAVLTVPMILFVLPPLFIVLIGPGALRFIDNISKVSIAN